MKHAVVRRLAIRGEHVRSSGRGHDRIFGNAKAADNRLTTPARAVATALRARQPTPQDGVAS
jgi:hypothetical protein